MLQLHILKCFSWLRYQITFLHTLVFVFLICKLSVLTHEREAVTINLVWKRGVFHSCRSCSLPLNLESQSLLCKRRNFGCWGAELLKGLSCSHLRDQQGLKYFETNLQIRVIIIMLLRKPNLLASRTVRKRPKSFCGRNLIM